MKSHRYRAIAPDGRIVLGTMLAVDIDELDHHLQSRGLELVSARTGATALSLLHMRPHIPRRELIHFCLHLEQLLDAGIPAVDALVDLRDATRHRHMQAVVAQLIEDIENGSSLSAAVSQHPGAFDPVFCSLIAAGEQTGTLAPVLRQLGQTLERTEELRSHARKLAIYPLIVGMVLLAAIVVALLFVVPALSRLFLSTGQALPLQTRVLIELSHIISRHGALLATASILAVATMMLLHRNSTRARFQLDRLRLKLPVIGPLQYKIAMARVAALIAMLYAAGITLLDALHTARTASGNLAIEHSLREAAERIVEGFGIASAFEATGLFPHLIIRMLRIGEQTGALDTALGKVAHFYTRDTRESIERLQAGAEPALTVLLGMFMLWVVFAVLGPVYDILTRLPL